MNAKVNELMFEMEELENDCKKLEGLILALNYSSSELNGSGLENCLWLASDLGQSIVERFDSLYKTVSEIDSIEKQLEEKKENQKKELCSFISKEIKSAIALKGLSIPEIDYYALLMDCMKKGLSEIDNNFISEDDEERLKDRITEYIEDQIEEIADHAADIAEQNAETAE